MYNHALTDMKYIPKTLLLSSCLLVLTGCGTRAVYTGESFAIDSPFRMRTEGEVTLACESARRALLGQGYLIESANSEGVKGRKAYRSEDKQNTFIEMNIVCLPETNGSTLFANGLLTGYEVKKSASAASVGVSALGSISLPIGQSADSLVKVSEETINDKDFYQRFFAAVGSILREREANRALPEPKAEPVELEPAPIPEIPVPASESSPSQPATPRVPDKSPESSAQETLPEPLPSEEVPAEISLEPTPVPAEPATSTEPIPSQEVPAITPELPSTEDVPPAEVLEPTLVPEIPAPTAPQSAPPPVAPEEPSAPEESASEIELF